MRNPKDIILVTSLPDGTVISGTYEEVAEKLRDYRENGR